MMEVIIAVAVVWFTIAIITGSIAIGHLIALGR